MRINDLEKKFDTSKLRYDDFNPWPLIKLKLIKKSNFEQKSKNFNYKNEVKKESNLKKIISFFKSFFHYLRNPIQNDKVDILYFIKSYQTRKNSNNNYFNEFSDPMVYFVGRELNIKVLELNDMKLFENRRYEYPNTASIDFVKYLSLIRIKIKTIFGISKKPTNIGLLKNELNVSSLEKELITLNEFSKTFEKILKKNRPKIVYLVCFYDMYSMAMSLACHRLNIKVIEYQHGFLNDYYSMYTKWSNVPSSGYELIPDIFWVWDNETKNKIDEWANSTSKHSAIAGGNMWLSYYKKTNPLINLRKNNKKKNILVVLQFSPLPEFFMNYLKKNKGKFNWYFRKHPLHPVPNNIKNTLENFSIESIDTTSEKSLYETFSFIDAIITLYSSVGFEAQCYKIPSIFMGENAKYGFKKLLGKNGLYFAENESDLDNYFNSLESLSQIDKFYIEFDEDKIKKEIKRIFNT